MYGKFFASTFTGSMFGAGTDVFALWGYVIANAVDGTVEINPSFVAAVLGTTPDKIGAALDVLCSPDAASRSEAEDGRRLRHEGAYQYFVVNHARYRAIRNEDDRRAYNREAKRRERAKSNDVSLTVNDCQPCQPKQRTESEAESGENMAATAAPVSKASKPKAPPDPRVTPFLKWFAAESEAITHVPYAVEWQRDAAIVKALYKTYSDRQLRELAWTLLHTADDWHDKIGRTIPTLKRQANVLAERRTQTLALYRQSNFRDDQLGIAAEVVS